MSKFANLATKVWVVARPDGLWHGPFRTEADATDFFEWKKERKTLIEGAHSVKETTIERILERIEQNEKNKENKNES